MQTPTRDSYARLKEQLEGGKYLQHSNSLAASAHRTFLLAAQEVLLPELQQLASVLQEGALECEVFSSDEDYPAVGIRVDTFHAVLRLSPADNPACIRAVIAGGSRPNDDLEWFIPYHQVRNGGLSRELQAVMLHLLRRSR